MTEYRVFWTRYASELNSIVDSLKEPDIPLRASWWGWNDHKTDVLFYCSFLQQLLQGNNTRRFNFSTCPVFASGPPPGTWPASTALLRRTATRCPHPVHRESGQLSYRENFIFSDLGHSSETQTIAEGQKWRSIDSFLWYSVLTPLPPCCTVTKTSTKVWQMEWAYFVTVVYRFLFFYQ